MPRTAIDSLLAVLPLPFVSEIIYKFLENEKDETVLGELIVLTTERICRSNSGDIALKQALAALLSSLNTIVKSERKSLTEIALQSIRQLSRAHGKAEYASFETVLEAIIHHGIASKDGAIRSAAYECLLSMLYNVSPIWLTLVLSSGLEFCLSSLR